ncbi:MAG: translation initiation factor IF-2 [Alphaproteobacteria bacterium]|nr:translation initiation factor IF-2 [Alphaproteobacteria bacterium]
MSEDKNDNGKKTLSLTTKLDPSKAATGQVRQSFSHGRSKQVAVEVKKKKVINKPTEGQPIVSEKMAQAMAAIPKGLTEKEWHARLNAVKAESERAKLAEEARIAAEIEEQKRKEEEQRLAEEIKNNPAIEEPVASPAEEVASIEEDEEESVPEAPASFPVKKAAKEDEDAADDDSDFKKKQKHDAVKASVVKKDASRREGKMTLEKALIITEVGEELETRQRSQAAARRAREKAYKKSNQQAFEPKKIVREVIIPETITVQELANRMAVRTTEVIKSLMKMGVMATIHQMLDADTAELVVEEAGHIVKRVSEADVEIGLGGVSNDVETLMPRAPVVTVMGHVDHGKTSLLDAIRETDVVAKEAGGITQHIGAYQVHLPETLNTITFIDTPGHSAFTEMRARGAKVTDIVVLVVAADDGIKEQTIEAISHVKAAGVPMIVAINKIDKPGADPSRVRTELLSQDIVVESLGGDVMDVEISAKQRLNIDKLLETILIQAEILELKANPNRAAQGAVVEAKMEKGRGSIATVLVQHGTLRIGDVFVAGSQVGKVRALIDEHGVNIESAGPSMPVEILGFNDTPYAGDDFHVVNNEARAREIAQYRLHRDKTLMASKSKMTLEDMFAAQSNVDRKELSIVIKGDVGGSVEALVGSLSKFNNDEVHVRVLHSGVGGITERDVILANASNGLIVGFNVRANPQARDLAKKEGISIRYYSIIYDVIDDVKAALTGMLSPTLREKYLGQAEIRQIYNITKVGKVAGCMVTEGTVKRGAKVRLLRDDVVIHEGTLKTLRRFKDELKEVKEGYECGMAFENYHDIKENDKIECFEIEEIARTL